MNGRILETGMIDFGKDNSLVYKTDLIAVLSAKCEALEKDIEQDFNRWHRSIQKMNAPNILFMSEGRENGGFSESIRSFINEALSEHEGNISETDQAINQLIQDENATRSNARKKGITMLDDIEEKLKRYAELKQKIENLEFFIENRSKSLQTDIEGMRKQVVEVQTTFNAPEIQAKITELKTQFSSLRGKDSKKEILQS